MSWATLGSLALPFHLNRNATALKSEISRLGIEATTGEAQRPQALLKGSLTPLAAVEARIARVATFGQTARLALTRTDAAQAALGQVAGLGQASASRMLTAAAGAGDDAVLTAGGAARAALGDAVATLSQQVAGQAVFSGVATDRAPLVPADAMFAALGPVVAGLTSADAVAAAVTAAFLDPGGLFETAFYQGSTEAAGGLIDAGQAADALPTAADAGVRTLLAGLAISALAGDPALGLDAGQRRALAQTGAERLLSADRGMTALQARVGTAQERLDTRVTQLIGERDALSLARQELVGVDPYEAVTQLENAQTRLQSIYAVTARTARLSLTEYL
ncbi:MAG: hypothetical protein H6900_02890 [Rhodobacter sp.]|nr:hypothetical protein [Rhodobacter sp.]